MHAVVMLFVIIYLVSKRIQARIEVESATKQARRRAHAHNLTKTIAKRYGMLIKLGPKGPKRSKTMFFTSKALLDAASKP